MTNTVLSMIINGSNKLLILAQLMWLIVPRLCLDHFVGSICPQLFAFVIMSCYHTLCWVRCFCFCVDICILYLWLIYCSHTVRLVVFSLYRVSELMWLCDDSVWPTLTSRTQTATRRCIWPWPVVNSASLHCWSPPMLTPTARTVALTVNCRTSRRSQVRMNRLMVQQRMNLMKLLSRKEQAELLVRWRLVMIRWITIRVRITIKKLVHWDDLKFAVAVDHALQLLACKTQSISQTRYYNVSWSYTDWASARLWLYVVAKLENTQIRFIAYIVKLLNEFTVIAWGPKITSVPQSDKLVVTVIRSIIRSVKGVICCILLVIFVCLYTSVVSHSAVLYKLVLCYSISLLNFILVYCYLHWQCLGIDNVFTVIVICMQWRSMQKYTIRCIRITRKFGDGIYRYLMYIAVKGR